MRLTTRLAVIGFTAVFAGGSCGGSGGGPSGPSATLTGSVRGVVRDDQGAGVGSATVQLAATGKSTRNTTSAADGTFAFTNVEVGVWQVVVLAPTGFSGGSTPTVTVAANQEANVAAIVLTKLPAGAAPSSADVIMYGGAFVPSNATIRVGGTIRFRNTDPDAHTATGAAFNTGVLNANATSTQSFPNAGTFNYVCTIHPGMTGTISVVQ